MTAAGHIDDLIDFVAASPTSYHAADEAARRFDAAGFAWQDEAEPWDASPGGHYIVRDGSVVAWRIADDADPTLGFRIVGAHTDSPTFKVKPHPDVDRLGWGQVGVEVYGGALLNSWLDRELGIAGRIVDATGQQHLVRTGALMRIPQLAIHLDRAVNDEGLKLDRQLHTQPVWTIASPHPSVLAVVASDTGLGADDIVGFDLFAFDTARGTRFGGDAEFLACGRLDNLSSVHAGLVALLDAEDTSGAIPVFAAFDHEEVGSGSRSGAAGPILADVLERIAYSLGANHDERLRAYARSMCMSSDAGHAIHPNYPGRHDPANQPLAGAGPLLKLNANQRYASDAPGTAVWHRACQAAGVPYQPFVSNNQVPCGSTIGPITATRLGITTVDVGVPLLSMHSAREMCAIADPYRLARALRAYWSAD